VCVCVCALCLGVWVRERVRTYQWFYPAVLVHWGRQACSARLKRHAALAIDNHHRHHHHPGPGAARPSGSSAIVVIASRSDDGTGNNDERDRDTHQHGVAGIYNRSSAVNAPGGTTSSSSTAGRTSQPKRPQPLALGRYLVREDDDDDDGDDDDNDDGDGDGDDDVDDDEREEGGGARREAPPGDEQRLSVLNPYNSCCGYLGCVSFVVLWSLLSVTFGVYHLLATAQVRGCMCFGRWWRGGWVALDLIV
jgi:hypothetical protein